MTIFVCMRYAMFIRQLMEDMGHTFTGPTIIYEDNKSAIFMIGQYHATQHSRHMDRRYKRINEMVRLGNIYKCWHVFFLTLCILLHKHTWVISDAIHPPSSNTLRNSL